MLLPKNKIPLTKYQKVIIKAFFIAFIPSASAIITAFCWNKINDPMKCAMLFTGLMFSAVTFITLVENWD